MPHVKLPGSTLTCLLGLAACGAGDTTTPAADTVLARLAVEPRRTLATIGGVDVMAGGFGSSAANHPSDPRRIALLTDRGPNVDAGPDTKAFPVPAFAPRIGIYTLVDGPGGVGVVLDRVIELRGADGAPLSGLPHPRGPGATGETARTPAGEPVDPDPAGIDPEGLHWLRDGSFWVADEYGPGLLHFDSAGILLTRLEPAGTGPGIPAVLARRWPNRGFEGLTGDPDGNTLIAVLQSPLDNPREAGRVSRWTRILAFDPASGRSRQYLYPLETVGGSVSDLAWLGPDTVLAIEHDGEMPGGSPPSAVKRVFRLILTGATDVSDPDNGPAGFERAGKTPEQMSAAELAALGIALATKQPVADLLGLSYPHDKPEGLLILGPDRLGIVNDDDFGITEGPDGRPAVKRLPAAGGDADRNVLWIIRLARALR